MLCHQQRKNGKGEPTAANCQIATSLPENLKAEYPLSGFWGYHAFK